MPIVRTFITAMAGVGRMDPKRYFTYSAIGGVAWAAGLTILGYFLGQVEFIRKNLELTLIAIVLLSVVPIIFEVIKARKEKKSLLQEEADDITQVMDAQVKDDSTQIIPRVER